MEEKFFDSFTGESYPSYSPSTATRTLGSGWSINSSQGFISNDFSGESVASTYTFNPEPPFPENGFTVVFSEATFTSTTSSIYMYVNGIELVGEPIIDSESVTLISGSFPDVKTIESIYFLVNNGANKGTTTLYSFSSDLYVTVCLAPQSKILTQSGYKELQDIQRGEELPQGRVARVIETFLSPDSTIDLVVIEKEKFLSGKLPLEDIFLCSNHILIHEGERKLAKELAASKLVRVRDVLQPARDGKYKLLDIQFDFEGSYTVSGLTSQSRSPYCKISPLPKELYWNIENYKEVRVDNTLCEANM